VTAAPELEHRPVDRAPTAALRAELQVASVASGLLLLLDAHLLTGRLPLEIQVQVGRLRHAVKVAIQAQAGRPIPMPGPAGVDPAAALRSWIAAQPWAQPGPQGWVYLLCFRDPATGQHQPLQGQGPPGAPGTPPAPRHRLWVVGGCVPGTVVGTPVVLGTVAAGAVVVGTPTGAVVVGAGPDGDVVDVPGARVAGGGDRSPPATTTPTEVLPPCCDRLPNKLASGWLATVSTPVIATTAIPKASTAATATRCQRIGWGSASLAPSSLTSAWSPTRRTSERRATLWADASEWVYTASAGATSRLTSAAPIRVPSTPKKDATTAPLTAASAPASNLGTRSCSISHLEVRVGTAALPCGGHGRSRIRDPAAAWRAPTLATQAGSRQVSPSQRGDRAAWGSCSLGDRSFKAALVGRAELQAAQGSGGPEVAHDRAHVGPPRVHQSQRAGIVSDSCAEILLIDQESCSSMRARRARWLSRDNARAVFSNALTNSRQIQHWTLDLPTRLVDHAAGRGARLMEVVGELGIGWQLARIWTGTRTREHSLKRSGGAARRCPVCRLAALGLQPPRPIDPLTVELGARIAALASPLEPPPAVAA
jgi:hypothetical protein